MRRLTIVFALAALALPILLAPSCPLPEPVERDRIELPGLSERVQVSSDALGVPHVFASTLEDALRVQGYLHARDRFFQMDVLRRSADGRLAELTGSFFDLLADAQTRLFDLRRAAERDAALLDVREEQLLEAYVDGVNAWLASNPLPAEYAELEISSVPPWQGLDTLMMAKGNDAQLNTSWELWDTPTLESYEAAGNQAGFDGRALFFEDLMRIAPAVAAATVPDSGGTTPFAASSSSNESGRRLVGAIREGHLKPRATAVAQKLARGPARGGASVGSNVWGVAAWASAEGVPMIAGDSHVELTVPAPGYEIHLVVEDDPAFGELNVSGAQTPGAPGIAGGQSQFIAWGGTAFFGDVSDTFQDRLVRGDPACSVRLCIESAGELHPVEERSEVYRMNSLGNGVLDDTIDMTATVALLAPEAVKVLRVPFRSFGPILEVADRSVVDDPGSSLAETTALTRQYSGLHGTRIGRALFGMMTARDVAEFGEAVRYFAGTLKHFMVADIAGNLAYFASGEIPLRPDLEAGHVAGNQPWLVRDGSGPCNWIRDPLSLQGQQDPPYSQGQIIPFLVIPPDEMPSVVNPARGFVVNANNDPTGSTSTTTW